MSLGILGKKLGMTQVFGEDSSCTPVTAIEAGPCIVVQKKSKEKEGYVAIQLGFGQIREKLVKKSKAGQFRKAGLPLKRFLREFRGDEVGSFEIGQEIKADIFKEGDYVDVSGISKGKGFTGVVKRWNFKGGKATHGSMFHRAPGSIGASSDPSRVFKGSRLPGRMGGKRQTVQNLKVVKNDSEKNLLLIEGAVPGANGGLLIIRKAIKKR